MTAKLICIWVGWTIGGILASLVLDLSASREIEDAIEAALLLAAVRVTS